MQVLVPFLMRLLLSIFMWVEVFKPGGILECRSLGLDPIRLVMPDPGYRFEKGSYNISISPKMTRIGVDLVCYTLLERLTLIALLFGSHVNTAFA
ncbi:Uncharacterised protein [uncultured archaeon]|nr:Uncharacterised protein [uncultured archaeon]